MKKRRKKETPEERVARLEWYAQIDARVARTRALVLRRPGAREQLGLDSKS
jgi:hypothetical protein